MSAEKLVTPVELGNPWDAIALDPTVTHGLVVVGESQAGKSSFTGIAATEWERLGDNVKAYTFPMSIVFRGLASEIISTNGFSFEEKMPTALFSEKLEEFIVSHTTEDFEAMLAEYFANPKANDDLRNKAVNNSVALVAEHEYVRPLSEEVSAARLSNILEDPGLIEHDVAPSLILLDSRNYIESLEKFTRIGIRALGTFVLTCNEEVVAGRVKDLDVEDLRARNKRDRERRLGPTTLPEDLELCFDLASIRGKYEALYAAGILMASMATSGMHIDTEHVSKSDEAEALPYIFAGMLAAD